MNEPACWSWPVPPLVDAEVEIARLTAANALLPPDQQRHPKAFWYLLRDPALYRFVEFHAYRCGLCGLAGDRLVKDHCHWTGLTRGLLCRGCNVTEGSAYGTPDDVVAYRERPPAVIVEYRSFYTDGAMWTAGWWRDETLARALTGNPTWHDGVTLGPHADEERSRSRITR